MQLVGGGDLQISEEQIAGRVASAEKTRHPTKITADHGENHSGARHGGAEREGHARIIVQVRKADDEKHRQSREAQLPDCFGASRKECLGPRAESQRSYHGGSEDGSATRERLKDKDG